MFSEPINEAKELKKQYHYHAALRLLDNIPDSAKNEEYYLLKAQCYYQDFQLPKEVRFNKANSTLENIAKVCKNKSKC